MKYYAVMLVLLIMTATAFAGELAFPIEITDQEYNEAVNFWSGYYPMSLETPSRVASEIVKIKLYGLPVSYIHDFTKNIKKVTKKDILAAAQKYIDPDNMDFCIVSKASDIQEGLKSIGPVTVKNVDEM